MAIWRITCLLLTSWAQWNSQTGFGSRLWCSVPHFITSVKRICSLAILWGHQKRHEQFRMTEDNGNSWVCETWRDHDSRRSWASTSNLFYFVYLFHLAGSKHSLELHSHLFWEFYTQKWRSQKEGKEPKRHFNISQHHTFKRKCLSQ